ncbi:hypothetical protein JCM31598_25200 [Desulfonatronum parangueonense]
MPSQHLHTFVASRELKDRITKAAKRSNMSTSKFIKNAMSIYMNLDQEKVQKAIRIGNALDVEPSLIVNDLINQKLKL